MSDSDQGDMSVAPFYVDDAKTSVGELELIGGYIDPDGRRYYIASLREMTGHEEDILVDAKSPFYRRMTKIMANCMERIGDGDGNWITEKAKMLMVVDNLTAVDRAQIMFWLRRISVPNGNIFTFTMNCPSCGNKFRHSVDLSDLKEVPMKDPSKRVYEVTLPSGKIARCHIMLGKNEAAAAEAVRQTKDVFSAQILARVDEIDGKPATMYSVKDLSFRDRHHLRRTFEEMEGSIDTEFEIVCDRCGTQFDADIDVSSKDFFFPSETESS